MRKVIFYVILVTLISTAFASIDIIDIDSPFFVREGELVKARVSLGNYGETNERIYTTIEITGRNYAHQYKTAPYITKRGRESSIIIYFIAPPDEGEYRINVKAHNEDIYFYDWYRFRVIGDSGDFEAVLCGDDIVIDRNSRGKTNICIVNTGTDKDNYIMTLSNWDDYTIPKNVWTIGPSEQEIIPIDIFSLPDTEGGSYSLDVKIDSIKTGKTKNIRIPITIFGSDRDDTDINFDVSTTSSIVGDSVLINLTLLNKGIPKIYRIDINYSEEWVGNKIEPINLFLRTHEFRVVNLEFLPLKEGSYPLTLSIKTDEGEIYKREFRISSFDEGKERWGITGLFIGVGEGSAPLFIFGILIILGASFLILSYVLNKNYYYIHPKEKDKDINVEIQ